ncbi:MAG: EamA family transporter RarD, partial [Proteobacteria bacterium]|nr:EamA family transporter RarD [Pseudomonadota bacterium]
MMQTKSTWQGLAAGVGAFTIWGLLPLYWKALKAVPPFEILCHRIVWSLLFSGLLVLLLRRGGEVATALRSRRNLLLLGCSSLLIGINWLLYIWAVNTDHILECSLGYYI